MKALHTPPKRVALVSFSVKAPPVEGSDKVMSLSDAGAKKVANAMNAVGVPAIKKVFKDNGMDVLEPSEYLTDDDKKSFYSAFKIKIEGGASALSGFVSALSGTGRLAAGQGAADGYESFDEIGNVWTFASVTNSLGDELAKGLGVDAVLLVTNEVGSAYDRAWLNNVNMYLFGPNPVALDKEELGTGMFKDNRSGHIYAGATIKKGFKDVYLMPKDVPGLESLSEEKNYKGYDRIVESLSSKVATITREKSTEK